MAAALGIATAGTAFAVSSGGYDWGQQDCGVSADSWNSPGAQPGCHSTKLNVTDGSGHRWVEVGIRQTPTGQPPDPTNPDTSVSPGDPTNLVTGTQLYFGADDNLDNGEHDGVSRLNGTAASANGPSDGGAIVLNWHPGEVQTWDPFTVFTNPVPVADFGMGSCADGLCFSVQTRRRTVYHGTGSGSRNVYDYTSKTWDPYDCSSGDLNGELACHGSKASDPQTMDQYRATEAQSVYAEPGVQVYEDPDPQGSPIDPTAGPGPHPGETTLYPLPAAYVGTCGVVAGGGSTLVVPASPVTNGAGQVAITPNDVTHCA
jgi:hypothetical protein